MYSGEGGYVQWGGRVCTVGREVCTVVREGEGGYVQWWQYRH